MTSNAKKGTGKENDVRKIKISQGYDCQRTYRKAVCVGPGRMISLPNDFWGCIDLEAKNKEEMIFIQVTFGAKWNEKAREILLQKWPRFSKVQIWAWFGGRKRKKKHSNDCWVKAQCYDIYELDHDTYVFKKVKVVDAKGVTIPEAIL